MVPRGVGILLASRGSIFWTVTSVGPSPTTSASLRLVPGVNRNRFCMEDPRKDKVSVSEL